METVAKSSDPYAQYAWFRAHDPIHVGQPGWPLGQPQVRLFRYADVKQWMTDPRMIRQFTKLPEFQALRKMQRWAPPARDTFASISRQFMLFQDPPSHTRLRRITSKAFTQWIAMDQRKNIEAMANGLLEIFRKEQGGQGDLLQAVAYPLPLLVTASMLGIPQEDRHYFRALSAMIGLTIDAPAERQTVNQGRIDEATRELSDYLRGLLARRRQHWEDDFTSFLVTARDDNGDILNEEELISTCLLIIVASLENMANVIGNSTFGILQHRDQWDRLVNDLSLAGNAAEELMRFDSPVQFTGRIASDDIEIDGVRVARGSEVLFMLGSANRDETVWDEPDTVKIDRHVGRHMAFGAGAHFCMGATLARLESEVTLRTLALEASKLELIHPEPTWRPVVHGLRRLDVRLQP